MNESHERKRTRNVKNKKLFYHIEICMNSYFYFTYFVLQLTLNKIQIIITCNCNHAGVILFFFLMNKGNNQVILLIRAQNRNEKKKN